MRFQKAAALVCFFGVVACTSLDNLQRSINPDGLTRSERLERLEKAPLNDQNYEDKTRSCRHMGSERFATNHTKVLVSSFYDDTRPVPAEAEFNFRYVKKPSLAFISDNQQITRSCAAVLAKLGIKTHIEQKDCPGCLDVFLAHEFEMKEQQGGVTTSCVPVGTGTYCYSGSRTEWVGRRVLSVVFVLPGEKEPRYTSVAASSGIADVSTVMLSKELCIAAFAGYPKRRHNQVYELAYCPDPQ